MSRIDSKPSILSHDREMAGLNRQWDGLSDKSALESKQTLHGTIDQRPVPPRQAAPRRLLWRKATFESIRRAFLKIALRFEKLKSCVRIALPSKYPYRPTLASMAGRTTAQGL